MSMRSRARALQRATGLTYQQAQAKIRGLGAAPAALKKKTGWTLERCDLVLATGASIAPLGRRAAPAEARSALSQICENLKESANAEAVWWIGRDGGRAFAGSMGFAHLAGSAATSRLKQSVDELRAWLTERVTEHRLHLEPVVGAGVLVVLYGEGSSLGIVRLASRNAAAALAKLLAAAPGWIPKAGGSPPSGAPAQVAAGLAWPSWKPPNPVDPN